MEPCAHEPGCGGGLLWFHIDPGVDYEEQVHAALNAAEAYGTPVCGVCFIEEDGQMLYVAYETHRVLH